MARIIVAGALLQPNHAGDDEKQKVDFPSLSCEPGCSQFVVWYSQNPGNDVLQMLQLEEQGRFER